jgi:uncharacterized protein YecT (DUF1311 family)
MSRDVCIHASLGAAALLLAAPLGAQAPASACVATARTQTSLTACARTADSAIQRRLATLLAGLGLQLDSVRAARLETVQQQWVIYRDAHCRWEAAAFETGSVQPMWEANCRAELTRERINVLRYQLCEGAGMTGSCPAAEQFAPGRPDSTRRR